MENPQRAEEILGLGGKSRFSDDGLVFQGDIQVMESGCDYSSYFSYTDFILYLNMMVPAQNYHKMITSTYIPGDGLWVGASVEMLTAKRKASQHYSL